MSDIVIIENNELKIDSVDLANEFGIKYDNFWKLLIKHKAKIERHGVLVLGTRKPKTGRPMQIATLTEPQALMLLTYTRSSEKTDELKFKLINEFRIMKEFLNKKYITRAIGKETRKTLTDAIEESGENERMHGHGFSQYTLFVYSIIGIKDQYKAWKKENKGNKNILPANGFRGLLTADELERVELAESLIKPLLKLEKEYSEIKETLEPLFKTKEIE